MIFEKTDDKHSWHIQECKSAELSSSVGGIKMTVYYLDGMKIIAIVRQYCEEDVLDKEKKKSVIWTSIERSNPSGPLRFELLQLDTLPVESIYK